MVKVEADQQTSEAKLQDALKSRLQHFRDNAASLTLVAIRRLLEQDLGLEKNALDVHKTFIKQYIDKNLPADEEIDSEKSEGKVSKGENSTVEKGEDLIAVSHKDDAKLDDSPIKGVLDTNSEKVSSSQWDGISESMIKKAIQERAEYIRSQSEMLTLAGARRFLEEDLKLSKNSLDPFKKFIRQEIEKVIDSGVVSSSATASQKGSSRISQNNAERSTSSEGRQGSADRDNNPKDHKKRATDRSRGEAKNSDREKKRKVTKMTDVSGKKQSKLAKKNLEEDSNADNDNLGSVSEDEPQSSAEKPSKNEAQTSGYGKHVERLKSVIKACGMSIAPTVYKKAKMVPDSKRESFLIKELEGILLKEGLSKTPSEKEIKEVRKRKERAKELEGIDMSNIITSSRRRATMSFLPPPRPKKNEGSGGDFTSTKKDRDDAKDAEMKEEDVKEKEDKDQTDEKKKGDDDGVDQEEEEDDEDEDDDDEEDDDSLNEEFNDEDEGSD